MIDRQLEPYIKLDQFLKWQKVAQTGGEAKVRIKAEEVAVNGEIETRRGRKLRTGDRVTVFGKTYQVRL
jgi:ribosome-associated protein